MSGADHWDTVYGTKRTDEVSWFQERPETSLRLLSRFGDRSASVIDVGAGESYLVDALLDDGWTDVTVLDVSGEAVAAVEQRLAARDGVCFVVADLLAWRPERLYSLWHDRAVLHFLTESSQQEHYSPLSAAAIAPGGIAILGTFAPDGPTQCSGLPTCRYDARCCQRCAARASSWNTTSARNTRRPGARSNRSPGSYCVGSSRHCSGRGRAWQRILSR